MQLWQSDEAGSGHDQRDVPVKRVLGPLADALADRVAEVTGGAAAAAWRAFTDHLSPRKKPDLAGIGGETSSATYIALRITILHGWLILVAGYAEYGELNRIEIEEDWLHVIRMKPSTRDAAGLDRIADRFIHLRTPAGAGQGPPCSPLFWRTAPSSLSRVADAPHG